MIGTSRWPRFTIACGAEEDEGVRVNTTHESLLIYSACCSDRPSLELRPQSCMTGAGSGLTTSFVCAVGLLINIRHIAPMNAQNNARARRHSAKVSPTVPETPNNFAIIIFPPSYVPTLPGLS